MKTCPQCHTKYTDDTLKFCLQDGKPLESIGDEATVVFDQDSFSEDKTIADNFSEKTQDYTGKTIEYENQQRDTDQAVIGRKQYIPINSQETVPRPKSLVQSPTIDNVQTPTEKGGFGILAGFVIGVLIIGLIGAGILAAIYLPSILGENNNSTANTNEKTPEKTNDKILSDTSEVKVSASSSRKQDSGNFYYPKNAFDGNSRTAWAEGAKNEGIGEWIVFDFAKEYKLKKIIIEPGYFKTKELWSKNNRLKVVNLVFSDGTIKSVTFPNEMRVQTINTEKIRTKSVMIKIKDVYGGRTDRKDTLISEVRFAVE